VISASKILLLDIETLPNEGLMWGTYKQNVLEIRQHTTVCSYSAKWLGGPHITRAIPDTKHKHVRDDYRLVGELWHLLDEAEIVIAHYGDGFDLPTLRARFAAHQLNPPSPWRSIDTKKISSKLFYWGGSHKLDHICHYLGIGTKMDTGGWSLWKNCLANDPDAWAKMKLYNAHDITLLEGLYLRLRPWMVDHPAVGGLKECPKCGSAKMQSRGLARSKTRTYNRFQCQDCGGWSRSTRSVSGSAVTNV
jgi:hypothetical protein